MNIINLNPGSIYVISGPPVPQKSALLARSALPEGTVVSASALRRAVLGALPDIGGTERLFDCADMAIFDIMRKIVETRAAQRLTTVIDATHVNDEARADYFRIADKYGVPAKVLVLDVAQEEAKVANATSSTPVSAEKLGDFYARWQRESRFPFEVIPANSVLTLAPFSLSDDKVDVVGDVHGLYVELLAMLAKKGWVLGTDGVLRHPEGRILLFLGDLIDRGQQSLEVLRLVKNCVEAGTAICLQGNHELKAVRFWDMVNFKGVSNWSSYASAETCVALLREPRAEANALVEFMRRLPASIVYEPAKIAFCHADLNLFDPLVTPKSDCLYGHSMHGASDADREYQARYDAGLNKYTLFRGHLLQSSEQENVFSLERDQAFAGELVMLQLDVFLQNRALGNKAAFKAATVTEKCAFNFDTYSKKFDLAKGLDNAASKKLVQRNEEPKFGLKVYRVKPQVARDNAWDSNRSLRKAQGIVMDVAGNIVAHPFDKMLCYSPSLLPEGADAYSVIAVEKLHGFPVTVNRHPFEPGELLVASEDGFEARHLEYAKSLISGRMKSACLKYLARRDVTLILQVLRNDSHSVLSYRNDQLGLYLVGVRGQDEESMPWTESEVDAVAREVGLRRASWFKTTLGELKALNSSSETEGFVVRDYSREERHLFVLKSPYYLTRSLADKLPAEKIALLFTYPASFKKEIGAELFPLVDGLAATYSQASFSAFTEDERVAAVRKLADALVV